MASDTRQAAMPRVRWIWVPQRREGPIASAAKWIGLIVSFATAIVLGLIISETLASSGSDDLTFLMCFASIIIICGGWAIAHLSLLWRYQMRNSRKRLDRLTRHSAVPSFPKRLPQRAIELLMMYARVRPRKLRRLIRDCQPGVTVAIDFPIPPEFPAPTSNALAFEPVRLDVPDEGIVDVLTMNMEAQGYRVDVKRPPGIRGRLAAVRGSSAWRAISEWSWMIMWVGIFSYQWWSGTRTSYLVLGFGLFVLMTALGRFWRTANGRQWWLVPGGLIYREHRTWRRRTKVGLVTPENSPLVVKHSDEDGHASVIANSRIRKIPCSGYVAFCVLAAWISTAARPTKEEILAFFGPDAEWEGT